MKFLLINAHQLYKGVSRGRLNKSMFELAESEILTAGHVVQKTIIEEGYDIEEEVQKHLWADAIILQSPVYWFGTPWMHKKYVDEVFTAGMPRVALSDGRSRAELEKQYGTGGLMNGKKFMLSLTWNAPGSAFNDKNEYIFEGFSADEAMMAQTSVYKFCAVTIVPSFSCFDVVKNPQILSDMERFKTHLKEQFNL